MDTKKITCIECPEGCTLYIDHEGDKVIAVRGAKCAKGVEHGIKEMHEPVRLFSAAVLSEAGGIRMVPVRTDKPIPKKDLSRAMEEIKKMRLKKPVRAGDVIAKDFLGLRVKLIATRDSA